MGERYAILGPYEDDMAVVITRSGKLGYKRINEKLLRNGVSPFGVFKNFAGKIALMAWYDLAVCV